MSSHRRKPQLCVSDSPTCRRRSSVNLLVWSFTATAVALGLFVYNEDVRTIADLPFRSSSMSQELPLQPPAVASAAAGSPAGVREPDRNGSIRMKAPPTPVVPVPEGCDLFRGQWVYDDVTRPLYREDDCEFLTAQVTCMRNGRKEDKYQKWRWQPRDCSLPRYDANLLREKLRGKRMMFVGDSLNRNQWESMVCLANSGLPRWRNKLTFEGSRRIFTLTDYNATVEFYWAPFLVESNSDDPNIHSIQDRIIMPGSIRKHAANWKDVDYLIFNTYIWWMNTYTIKILRGSFQAGSTKYDKIERPEAYRRVMRTWADWVDQNVDPRRTTVFFCSMSPLHIKSSAWGNPKGIKCAMETEPVMNTTAPLDVGVDWRVFNVARKVMRRMKVPVTFLEVTKMSELRKDAHTSVHTIRQGKMLGPAEQADPETYADCIHWCLPGVPDTWNEFIYAKIIST